MKKPVFVAIVTCLALLAAGPLVTGSSADDLAFMLRATPENPRGWTTSVGALSGSPTGSAEFAGGHKVPDEQGDGDVTPHGGGSLVLRTGSNAKTVARAQHGYFDGAPVARIDIEYSWTVENRPRAEADPKTAAPGLELIVTGENGRETLHYEPHFNRTGPNPAFQWERDDAGPAESGDCKTKPGGPCGPGLWWRSSNPPPSDTDPPSSPADRRTALISSGHLFTLQTYGTSINPNATVATGVLGGAFAVRAGCSTRVVSGSTTTCESEWLNFEGAADDVTMERIGGTRTTYDLEPSIVAVRPDNLQGWSFGATPAAEGTPTPPTVALVTGPTDATDPEHEQDADLNDSDDPFFGLGSLRLEVGSNGNNVAEARHADFDGKSLEDLEGLVYGTYVMNRFASGGCEEAPYLALDVVAGGQAPPVTEEEVTLYFHPCDQTGFDTTAGTPGPVPLRTWQRWDAVHGNWRWACTATACTYGTLEDFFDENRPPSLPEEPEEPANVTVADTTAEGGSLRIAAGGAETNPNFQPARWANFVGHADFLTHDLGGATVAGRTYDFESKDVEPEPVPPTSSTTAPTGGTTTTTVTGGTTTTTVAGGTTTTTQPGATTTTTSQPGNTTTTTRPSGTATQVTRMDGADRMATAIDISQQQFPDNAGGAVVLARADNYPDALAASPVAANRGGPLLLTPSTNLDDRVAAEVHRVLPDGGTVHIAGGTNAIRTEVENELRNAGYNVIRHAGRNRFETATLLAEQIPQPTTAFLATGLNFADALPSGAAAAATRGVVLLTADSTMPAATAAYLNARPNLQRVAIGGPASRADPGATSVVGVDRFETAANVAKRFFTGVSSAGVASGTNYPDALAGGAHAGSRGGPLLLTRPESLPEPARQYLEANRNSLRNVFIYGGPNAVSTQTETQIRAATS